MLAVRSGPAVGLTALVALLATLGMTVGLGSLGWVVGLACGVVLNTSVAGGVARNGVTALGPADLVTLSRATLACGVAALTADSFVRPPAVATLVALTVVALVLDAVDGRIARHTRTTSMFGARFDGEVDAFLMLVLSVYVARDVGGWVLAIGGMRYAFAVAGWGVPWLRRQLPPRYWRRVVTAVQGVVLTVAAADVLPPWVAEAGLIAALALLAESFGRDVWWLWRHRHAAPTVATGRPGRREVAAVTNLVAVLLVWFALVAPNRADDMTLGAFLRIPVEGLVLVGLALVLPRRPRRITAVVAGVLLGLLTVWKLLDVGFYAALNRPYSVVTDQDYYFVPAFEVVSDSIGTTGATIAAASSAALVIAVLVCMPLAVVRVTGFVARHRDWSVRTLAGLAVIWIVGAASGLHVGSEEPLASVDAGGLVVGKVRAITADVQELQRFDAAIADDRYRDRADLLGGLRGKDVLVVFVESYGRIALEGTTTAARIRPTVDAGTRRLRATGFSTRSAYLTSPTFGGVSWLAHSTLQSGVWVDNQLLYERLLDSDRMTLSGFFHREGWRTVGVMPTNKDEWPEGEAFYQLDKVYNNFGYRGPEFGIADMPDQYALSEFQRRELASRDRTPLMAQVDLASSHAPWAPLPHMIDWNRLGDGSVFHRIRDRAQSTEEVWRDSDDVQAAYAKSIVYCLRTVVSFVERYGDDNLVLILVGDHQPAPIVSGHTSSRDVPITVIARDPAVIDRISGWGWQDGMRPDPDGPVWPMDAFRDRFLAAYSP
ncbi:MAG: CDP-alcohol phosphatidyltransferase family protein [Nocardioidaceae bacterium]